MAATNDAGLPEYGVTSPAEEFAKRMACKRRRGQFVSPFLLLGFRIHWVKPIQILRFYEHSGLARTDIARSYLGPFLRWEDYATQIGAAAYGVTWLTATYRVELSDHVGTHMDSLRHLGDHSPGAEGIPLEYCYGDGVVLDFRHKERGSGISSEEVQLAFEKIAYMLKPLDIILIMTGAGGYQNEQRYLTDHPGMTAGAIHWLLKGSR
jgi:hypothetical protein